METLLTLLIMLTSGLANPTGGVVTHSRAITPPQHTITCHDATWERETLHPIATHRVHSTLAPTIQRLLSDAQSNGIDLYITSSYRDCEEQTQYRERNCGLGPYNVLQRPSLSCAPPTEPAGQSMHNEGLAVDFGCRGVAVFSISDCYQWLKETGTTYGLYQHVAEEWHWSTTGI